MVIGLLLLGIIICPLLGVGLLMVSIADGIGLSLALGNRGSGVTAIALGGDVIIVGRISSVVDGWGAAGAWPETLGSLLVSKASCFFLA